MSHYQERTEKDCLNCGTIVEGLYCHKCGQENVVPKETFWGLLTHFVYDITHFDGKFFSTVKYLVSKPGFLSLEFIKGRRASYLHPIRMYVFTSAFFFVIFFTLYNAKTLVPSEKEKNTQQREKLLAAKENLQENFSTGLDSSERIASSKVILDLDRELAILDKKRGSLTEEPMIEYDSAKAEGLNFGKTSLNYKSVLAYKRMQLELPKDKRDGWIKKAFMTRILAAVEAGEKQGERAFVTGFINNLMHSFPKMLFVSLPLFALLLHLLYGRRKDLLYSDHAVFTIHLYCATFILLLWIFGLEYLYDISGWLIVEIVRLVSVFGIFHYLYKGMRRFYGQSRGKTIAKFLLLNMLSFFMMVLLLTIFTMISASQISPDGSH
ncbi:DUF3667 domain-containing protein [Flavihumibacter stibioxidans]|uniref:DUF3667 domain-containing protein n=1 Tax=Flavihumibacter stibioxidans TaxID=1834163 RepID=UPI001650B539